MSVVDGISNGEAATWRVGRLTAVEDTGPFPGRHASRVEIAAETPIFHSLTAGGPRSRPVSAVAPAPRHAPRPAPRTAPRPAPQPDPLAEFRRDPLTAPIPVQAYVAPAAADVVMIRQTRRSPAVPCAAAPAGGHGAHAQPERPLRSGRHSQFVPARPGGHRSR